MTTSLLGVMLLYAAVVAAVPRLRARLDQAGDNAYYLGLLFTRVSMALALYEFAMQSGTGSVDDARIAAIVGNFGVALATTISGIFLRIVLHQMRVDPADVEGMSRVELSEASKRVRATLDSVSGDIGRYHDEIRQKTSDSLNKLMNDVAQASAVLQGDVAKSSEQMLGAVAGVHAQALQQTAKLTGHIEEVPRAVAAIGRLRSATAAADTTRRLDKVSTVLEATGTNAERWRLCLTKRLARLQGRWNRSGVGAMVANSADAMANSQTSTASVAAAVEEVSKALRAVGQRLSEEQGLLVELTKQSRLAADDFRAREAAAEVLNSLTQIARTITQTIHAATPRRPDGAAS